MNLLDIIFEKLATPFIWLYDHLSEWLFYGLILLAGLFGIWFTYNYAIAFSDYFIVLLFAFIFIGIFHWFDTHVLKQIDTIYELKTGNTAYAIFLLSVAVLVLAAAVTVG